MMRPRTVTEVEVQLQKADPSIDVMKLVKARACDCSDVAVWQACAFGRLWPGWLERWCRILPCGSMLDPQAQNPACRQAHLDGRKAVRQG